MYIFPYSFFLKAKVVVHSHSSKGRYPKINTIFRQIVNWVVDTRLSCSKVASEWLFGKRYVQTTEIINNGIDTERFSYNNQQREKIRNQYEIQEEEFLIGHVGRFSHAKNHEFIIEIFENILRINNKAKLMLVGVGGKQKLIQELCKDKKIEDKVIFTGRQSKTNEFYSAFDVFLMPSLFEGLPVVGIEAQSEGLPCYFSNTIDKQISITNNAYVYSLLDSAEEWATKIVQNGKNLNRDNHNMIVRTAGYDIKDTVHKIEEIYDETI